MVRYYENSWYGHASLNEGDGKKWVDWDIFNSISNRTWRLNREKGMGCQRWLQGVGNWRGGRWNNFVGQGVCIEMLAYQLFSLNQAMHLYKLNSSSSIDLASHSYWSGNYSRRRVGQILMRTSSWRCPVSCTNFKPNSAWFVHRLLWITCGADWIDSRKHGSHPLVSSHLSANPPVLCGCLHKSKN